MTRSPKRRYHKGPVGRAVIAGVLAAVGVTLGISVEPIAAMYSQTLSPNSSPTDFNSYLAR